QTELVMGAGSFSSNDVHTINYCVAGERWTAASTVSGIPSTLVQIIACEMTTGTFSATRMYEAVIFSNCFYADGTFTAVGTRGRWASTSNLFSDMSLMGISNAAFVGGIVNLIENVFRYQGLGQGSVFAFGFNDANGAGIGTSSTNANQAGQRALGNTFSSA